MGKLKKKLKKLSPLFYVAVLLLSLGAVIILVVKPILVAPYAGIVYLILDFLSSLPKKKK